MSQNLIAHTFISGNHSLHATAANFHGAFVPDYVRPAIESAFTELAPHLADDLQTLYIRDLAFLAIDGKYAGGHCFNRSEAAIAVPNWAIDQCQVVAAINHELHHLARWQTVGYGTTLGGAIVSEGIATYYERLRSGWQSPWSQATVTKNHAQQALKEWKNEHYNHNDWFYEGTRGKWIGYGLGVQLARELFAGKFDLRESLFITADKAKATFETLLNQLDT
jgi:uncharacterized protein YjaZ